jgi:hypothetical protein
MFFFVCFGIQFWFFFCGVLGWFLGFVEVMLIICGCFESCDFFFVPCVIEDCFDLSSL